jgi:hypothetical protein
MQTLQVYFEYRSAQNCLLRDLTKHGAGCLRLPRPHTPLTASAPASNPPLHPRVHTTGWSSSGPTTPRVSPRGTRCLSGGCPSTLPRERSAATSQTCSRYLQPYWPLQPCRALDVHGPRGSVCICVCFPSILLALFGLPAVAAWGHALPPLHFQLSHTGPHTL